VFGGGAHPALTAEICAYLAVPQRPVRLKRFANDCLKVQLQANCREREVFIIQPLVPSVQEHLAELLLMADAARARRRRG
jgi:ribose-phosphate pyrophosphokinase